MTDRQTEAREIWASWFVAVQVIDHRHRVECSCSVPAASGEKAWKSDHNTAIFLSPLTVYEYV